MGSVPNSQWEISTRYGIRWFKCKLKPPKNYIVEKRKNVPVTRRQEPLYFKSCNYLEISELTLFNAFIFVYTPEDNIQVLKSKPGKWAI